MARKKTSKFKNKVAQNTHKQKNQGSQYGHLNLPKGVSVFKEEPNTRVKLDIIPYEVTDLKHLDRDDNAGIAIPGDLWYKKPYKLHRNVGADNKSVVCPTSIGKECPICNYRAEQLKQGVDYEDMRPFRPSLRNLYLVIPKDSKNYEEKIHIWDISQFLFQDALNEEIEENEDFGAFPDLEEGYTLRIRFSEDSFGKNKFAKVSRIDFIERDEPYDEEILKKVPNLDEVLSVPSYKELEALFFELDVEPNPEEDIKEDNDNYEDNEEMEEITEQVEKSNRKKKKIKESELIPQDEEQDEAQDDQDEEIEEINENNICVACEGTGRDSKGKICRICKGTGKVIEESEEIEEMEEESEPKFKKKTKSAESNKKKDNDKCPFGYRFGIDTDEYEDCDDCDIWDDCIDEKEG